LLRLSLRFREEVEQGGCTRLRQEGRAHA
jgi:hypothetical protein